MDTDTTHTVSYSLSLSLPQGEVEGRCNKQLGLLSARLEAVEAGLEQESSEERLKRSESKHKARLGSLEKSLRQELDDVRSEYRSGEFRCSSLY